MPALAFENRTNDVEDASGAGPWLIPIFLVVLLFGVAIAVFRPKLTRAYIRTRPWFHVMKDTLFHPSRQFGNGDREVKGDPGAPTDTDVGIPISFSEPKCLVADNKRPPSLPYQLFPHDFPILCSSFSEDSLRSPHDLLDADECWLHEDESEKVPADDTAGVPQISFTPPTIEDLTSLAIAPLCALNDFLQAPSIDTCGHAVVQSRSMPSLSSSTIGRSKPKARRSISVVGNSAMDKDESRGTEAEYFGSFLAALYNTEKMVEKLQDGCDGPKKTQASDERRRNSITVKVSVPSTNDLWKLWVCREETVGEFTARVRAKVGADVALFTHNEDMIVSEDDWRLVVAGHKIFARPV